MNPLQPMMLGNLVGDIVQKNCMSLWEAFVAQLAAFSPCWSVQTSCTLCILAFRSLFPGPSPTKLRSGHRTSPVQTCLYVKSAVIWFQMGVPASLNCRWGGCYQQFSANCSQLRGGSQHGSQWHIASKE